MAYSRKTEEHSFKKIQRDLANGTFKSVIILGGREQYLVRWSRDRILEKYVNQAVEMFDLIRIDGTAASTPDIITACETMPMMSEKKVVLVEDYDFADAPQEDQEELADYIPSVPDSALLIFSGGSPDKRKKLYKAIKSSGSAYDFDRLDSQSLRGFIEKHLASYGKSFGRDVPLYIGEASGYFDKESDYTIDNMINDLAKIAAHAGDTITTEDVDETLTGNQAQDIFAFTDALAAGRKGEALKLLRRLRNTGSSEFQLLGLICSQFEVILLVSEMRADGMSTSQMSQRTGIHEFRIKKSVPLAGRYTPERLRSILKRAYEVDRNIKSGLMDADTALELLVAGV